MSYYPDMTEKVFRVVDKTGRTIWSGGCWNCAVKIAATNPDYRIG